MARKTRVFKCRTVDLGRLLLLLCSLTLADASHAQSSSPPTIGGTPPASVTVGSSYSFRPSGSDPDGQVLTFSVQNKPVWASFSSTTGRLSGSPGSGRIGRYSNIVIAVSDGDSTASLPPFSIAVLAPNSPPSISGVPPATVVVGKSYGFTPTASDPEGQTLSFSIANKPGWANFSTTTGRLSGSPGSGRVGTYVNIVITVSDGKASTPLGPFSIEVRPANTPPTIAGTPTDWATPGGLYTFTPTATDAEGQPLTFSIVNLPVWASFDRASGRLTGLPTTAHAGAWSGIVISVSDGKASASLGPFAITVEANGRPIIAGTPLGFVTAGKSYAFRPTASDPEGATLKFSIVNKPAWASFASSTGRLYGTPGSGRIGTYSGIRISVTDGQATVSLPEFSIRVVSADATGSATVSWSPPVSFIDGTPLSNLAGYLVVYGVSPSEMSNTLRIPSPLITSAAIEALPPGVWYFAVKAYTTGNIQSDLSRVAHKIIN